MLSARGVTPDQHPLDHEVGVALQQDAIDPRAGVALVGVADQEAPRLLRAGEESPLHPRREEGAASAGEPRVHDELAHRLRLQVALEHAVGGEVAVARDVVGDLLRVDAPDVREQAPPLLVLKERVPLYGRDPRPLAGEHADRELRGGADPPRRLVDENPDRIRRDRPEEHGRPVRPGDLREGLEPLQPVAGRAPDLDRGAPLLDRAQERLARGLAAGGERGGVPGEVDARDLGVRPRLVLGAGALQQLLEGGRGFSHGEIPPLKRPATRRRARRPGPDPRRPRGASRCARPRRR